MIHLCTLISITLFLFNKIYIFKAVESHQKPSHRTVGFPLYTIPLPPRVCMYSPHPHYPYTTLPPPPYLPHPTMSRLPRPISTDNLVLSPSSRVHRRRGQAADLLGHQGPRGRPGERHLCLTLWGREGVGEKWTGFRAGGSI